MEEVLIRSMQEILYSPDWSTKIDIKKREMEQTTAWIYEI